MKLKIYFLAAFLVFAFSKTRAQTYLSASNALIKRVLAKQHQTFLTESIVAENGLDVFEIESKKYSKNI